MKRLPSSMFKTIEIPDQGSVEGAHSHEVLEVVVVVKGLLGLAADGQDGLHGLHRVLAAQRLRT